MHLIVFLRPLGLPTRNTRFVGVVVAYRDIEKARWRAVIEVDPTGYDDIDVNVESLAVYMKD